MGDRGNIALKYANHEQPIYLYTHWSGSELPTILADALDSQEGRNRWGDEAYLARIIFDRLTDADRSEYGYGLSLDIQDNEHPILYVDLDEQTVTIEDTAAKTASAATAYPFERFIQLATAKTLPRWRFE